MPINIPSNLPAKAILEEENIFVMDEARAVRQDIRPLDILIFNLMPKKENTETQLLRLLSNTPLQVNITLLKTESHISRNTEPEHLNEFYTTFEEIKHRKFDGMIITGAPVEQLPFKEVTYWEELTSIMKWTKENVTSTLHICWGAQAALYYHYGVNKFPLSKKCFGIFKHTLNKTSEKLVRGFDDEFYVPHSRHTDIKKEELSGIPAIKILSESEEAGVCLLMAQNGKQIFLTGHPEYTSSTLLDEYYRDRERGLDIALPVNYKYSDDRVLEPAAQWRSHANLLFSNWLNYYVYQETPYLWK